MGWKDSACFFKKTANLSFKIWEEMGCPTSGVLFQIKKNTKTRYIYEVRHLTHRQNVMLQKIALFCGRKNKKRFLSEIRRHNHSHLNLPPVVDGVSGSRNIANYFCLKILGCVKHSTSTHSLLQTSVTDFALVRCVFSA